MIGTVYKKTVYYMKLIFLGIGSNLKNPARQVRLALKNIQKQKEFFEFRSSSLYQTTPISDIPQEDFINAVCQFKTLWSLKKLFKELCRIERVMGKKPKLQNAPRIIDIDLLLYGTEFVDTAELSIPHPRMLERLFVLKPLSDLQDEIEFPLSNTRSLKVDLKKECNQLESKEPDKIVKIIG